MAGKTVKLEFDVGLTSGSGENIRRQLQEILSGIGTDGLEIQSLKVNQSAISRLRSDIQKSLKDIPITFTASNITTSAGAIAAGAGSALRNVKTEMSKTLREYEKAMQEWKKHTLAGNKDKAEDAAKNAVSWAQKYEEIAKANKDIISLSESQSAIDAKRSKYLTEVSDKQRERIVQERQAAQESERRQRAEEEAAAAKKKFEEEAAEAAKKRSKEEEIASAKRTAEQNAAAVTQWVGNESNMKAAVAAAREQAEAEAEAVKNAQIRADLEKRLASYKKLEERSQKAAVSGKAEAGDLSKSAKDAAAAYEELANSITDAEQRQRALNDLAHAQAVIVKNTASSMEKAEEKQDVKDAEKASKDLNSLLGKYTSMMQKMQTARANGNLVGETAYAFQAEEAAEKYRELAEGIEDVAEKEKALSKLKEVEKSVTDAGTEALRRNTEELNRSNAEKEAAAAKNLASDISGQIGQLDGLTQAIVRNTSAYREWEAAQESFNAGEIGFEGLEEKANSLMSVMNEFLPASQTMSGTFSKLFGSLSNRALMSAIAVASRAIRDMISAVKELDAAFTQMQIVTGGSDRDIERFGINIAQTAKSIGSSVTDLVDSATVFARLGYTEGESTSLAKFTSMLSNVGNIDVGTAQNAITAIVKAYGMGVDEVETVMDKMVEVGNHFPISVAEIAEGMTNAGSTLRVAGNDINQSIALLTAANTSMQDISKSSTGLRTIAARLRRSETELNELGESVTTAKYQQMVDMLTKHSVSLVDENGELRDTYSIIQDIAAAWGDMSKNEQAALAEMAAGTRQQNVFTSLLLNFKEAQKAMSSMDTSTGSLTSAYDIYLESIQAHTGMFKAAFQELAQSVFDSGMITDAIDLGTSVVESLRPIASSITNITDAVGGLNGALSILAGALVIKNLTKIIGTVHNAVKGVENLGDVVGGLVNSLAIMRKTEFGPPEMIMSGGTVAAIGAGIAAITAYIAYVQRWKKAQEEMRTSTYDNAKAESNRLKTFDEIRERYIELGKKAEDGTLGADGFREIASLQSQIEANQGSINSLIGSQAGQVDLVNGKYQEQIDLLNQITGAQAERSAASARQAADLAFNDYVNAYDDSSALNNDNVLRSINGRIDYISEHLNRDVDWSFLSPDGAEIDFTKWLKSGTKSAGELSEALKTIYDDLANNNDWQDIVDQRYGNNYHVQLLSDIWSEYEIYNQKVRDVNDSVTELSESLLAQEANGKKATEPFAELADYNEYRNQLAGKLLEDPRVIGALREGIIDTSYLASQIDSTLASIAPEMFKQYKEAIGIGTESTMKEIVNTMPSMVGKSGMLTGVEDVSENITKLYGWLDKINSGDFDTKDLVDMLNEFPNLQTAADGVENLSTDLWKLADAVQGAINAAPNDMIKRIDDYMGSHILSDNVKAQMEAWKEYLRGMTDLTNVSMPERVSKLKEMQSAIYEAVGDTSGITLDQYNKLIKLNGEFADAIELDGNRVVVNTEKAMNVVRKMGVEYIETINDQIDADMKRIATLNAIEKTRGELTSSEAAERASLEQNIQKYQTLRGEILNTLSAYEQWRAAQGTANAGSEVDELRAAWEHLNKVTKGGKNKDALYGQIFTDDTRAAFELLGKDLEDFITNGVFDEKAAQKWLSGLNKYLNKGKQGVDDFLLDLKDAGLATYKDGIFQLADGFELSDAAKALDMSEDMVAAMLEYSTRFHDLDFSYIIEEYKKQQEAINAVTTAEEAHNKALEANKNLEAVEKENTGITNLLNLYDQLRQAESQRTQAQDMGAKGLVDSMDQQIQTIKDNISAVLSEPIDMTSVDSVREAINNAIQALNEEMETKKALGIEFDEESIKSQIENLTQDLSDIEAVVAISTEQQEDADTGALETTASILDSIKAKMDEISNATLKPDIDTSSIVTATERAAELEAALNQATADRVINIGTNFAGAVKDIWDKGKIKVGGDSGAYGGAFANGGNTLVGELGQEMVVDPENRYWYTVGDNGPEFIKLPKHAIVFNHKQTKSLLSRGKTNDRGTALASGTALAVASGAGGAKKELESAVSGLIGAAVKAVGGGLADLKRVNGKGKSSGSGGSGGGSGSGSGSSKKSSNKDNWFVKQYKENNHLLKMDKKEQKDYLNWLDGAYKKAYKQGIIDLDDYYKYQKWYTFCASSS